MAACVDPVTDRVKPGPERAETPGETSDLTVHAVDHQRSLKHDRREHPQPATARRDKSRCQHAKAETDDRHRVRRPTQAKADAAAAEPMSLSAVAGYVEAMSALQGDQIATSGPSDSGRVWFQIVKLF